MTGEPTDDSDKTSTTDNRPVRHKPRFTRVARLTGLVVVLMAACAFAGFVGFVEKIDAMTVPAASVRGDAIVVLTGGQRRIESALDLLRRKAAPRLLISGVNPTTTGGEIRRLTRSSKSLFSCCVDIGHDAIDTIGNAYETAHWIGEHGYKHVFLVTNNYHMPRSLMELRRVDPRTDFIPYPVTNTELDSGTWIARPAVVRRLLFEYAKYALASLRTLVGASTGTGLRTEHSATRTVQRMGTAR